MRWNKISHREINIFIGKPTYGLTRRLLLSLRSFLFVLLYFSSPLFSPSYSMSQEFDVFSGDLKDIGKKLRVIFPSQRKNAPDFAFGDGKRISELKGYVVLLNFWSPRCPPCVRELPQLNELYKKLKDRRFIVIGVYPDIDEDEVEELRKKLEITFPLVGDTDNRIREKYGVHAYPISYIVWKDGKFAGKVIGERKWDSEGIIQFFMYLIEVDELNLSP